MIGKPKTPEEMARIAQKRISERRDPLEEPGFRELDPDLQRAILAAPDAQARKRIAAEAEQGFAEAQLRMGEATAAGERLGPQSLQLPPTRQIEPTEGVELLSAKDILLEMRGRPGKPGFRIPGFAKRIGGKPGDPVQVGVAAGRVSKGALGVYKMFENVMRTQEGRDLVVAAHEWSHALHRHTLGQRGKNLTKAAKELGIHRTTLWRKLRKMGAL